MPTLNSQEEQYLKEYQKIINALIEAKSLDLSPDNFSNELEKFTQLLTDKQTLEGNWGGYQAGIARTISKTRDLKVADNPSSISYNRPLLGISTGVISALATSVNLYLNNKEEEEGNKASDYVAAASVAALVLVTFANAISWHKDAKAAHESILSQNANSRDANIEVLQELIANLTHHDIKIELDALRNTMAESTTNKSNVRAKYWEGVFKQDEKLPSIILGEGKNNFTNDDLRTLLKTSLKCTDAGILNKNSTDVEKINKEINKNLKIITDRVEKNKAENIGELIEFLDILLPNKERLLTLPSQPGEEAITISKDENLTTIQFKQGAESFDINAETDLKDLKKVTNGLQVNYLNVVEKAYLAVALSSYYGTVEKKFKESREVLEENKKMIEDYAILNEDQSIEAKLINLAELDNRLPTIYAQTLYHLGREYIISDPYNSVILEESCVIRDQIDSDKEGHIGSDTGRYNDEYNNSRNGIDDTLLFKRSAAFENRLKKLDRNFNKDEAINLLEDYEAITHKSDSYNIKVCQEKMVRVCNIMSKNVETQQDKLQLEQEIIPLAKQLIFSQRNPTQNNLENNLKEYPKEKRMILRSAANFAGILLNSHELGIKYELIDDAPNAPIGHLDKIEAINTFIEEENKDIVDNGIKFEVRDNKEKLANLKSKHEVQTAEDVKAEPQSITGSEEVKPQPMVKAHDEAKPQSKEAKAKPKGTFKPVKDETSRLAEDSKQNTNSL